MSRGKSINWGEQARLALPLLIEMPSNKVAQKLEISERGLAGFLERNNVVVPIKKFVRSKVAFEDLPLIYGLRDLKEPVKSIADKFDVCQSVIYRILKRPIEHWHEERRPVLMITRELRQLLKVVIKKSVTGDKRIRLIGVSVGALELDIKSEHALMAGKICIAKGSEWQLKDEGQAAVIADLLVMAGQIRKEIEHESKKRASTLQSRWWQY